MQKTLKLTLSAITAASVLALSGCGGGGDGGSSSSSSNTGTSTTTPAAPAAPASVAPAASVSVSTYTDQRVQLFDQLNAFRAAVGVGMLRQDSQLDVAAQAHATYLKTNNVISHTEDPSKPDYYEATPRSRATKAGVNTSEWVGEAAGQSTILPVSWVSICLRMTNSVYHLQALTSNVETVGLGINDATCVVDMGTITGVQGTPPDNGMPLSGGQQMAANAIGVAPVDGSSVDGTMPAESPQPAPDVAAPGHPLMARVRVDSASDALTVSSFTLVDNLGATVPGRILVPTNALSGSVSGAQADAMLYNGVAFFIPLSPLASAKTYTATFAGARNGTAISKSWNFHTN